MTEDFNDRLERLEHGHEEQRRRWLAAAAKNAGWHDSALAPRLVDANTIVTPADADNAVADIARQHPYLAVEKITEAEQRR